MAVVGEGFWGQRRRENVARHPVAISRPQHHLQVIGSLYGRHAHVHQGLRSARIIEFVHVSDVGCRLFLLILLLWAQWQSIPGHLSRLPCSANQDDRGHVFGCPGSAVHVALGAQIRLPWGRSSGSTVSVALGPGSIESRLVFRRKLSLGASVEILHVRRKLRNARSPNGDSALSVREHFAEHRFFFAER